MSHTVKISISLDEYDKNEISIICKESIQKIKNMWNITNPGIQKLINSKIDKILEIEKNKDKEISIDRNSDKNYHLEIYKDKLIKEMTNFVSSIKNNDFYEAFEYSTNNFEISKWIDNYGITSISAILNLKNKQEEINDNSISKEIDSIINQNSNEKIQNELKNEIINNIETFFKNDNDSMLRYYLKKQLNKINSYQELNDFNIYINSKYYIYKKMVHFQEVLMTGFKKIRGYYVNSLIQKKLNDNNEIVFLYHLKNNLNETLDLKIDENLNLSYKIGDYKDHCCEATSQKLWDFLENNKIKIINKKIIREFNNQKPLYKSINKINSQKEKSK